MTQTSEQKRRFNFDAVDPNAQEATRDSYRYFQWHHGNSDLEELGKDVRFTGGLIFPLTQRANKQGENLTIPGFNPVTVKIGGEKQNCLGATDAQFAVLRRRFCWARKPKGGKEELICARTHAYEKNSGMYGKMQSLAIPFGIAPEQSAENIFMISTSSTAQINFSEAMKAHESEIVAIANQTAPAGKKLPPYAFYTHIGAAKHEAVGVGDDSSEVTQPMLYRPAAITEDYLFELYIDQPGQERLPIFQELWISLEEWAHAWDTDAGVRGRELPAVSAWTCGEALQRQYESLLFACGKAGLSVQELEAHLLSVNRNQIEVVDAVTMQDAINWLGLRLRAHTSTLNVGAQAPAAVAAAAPAPFAPPTDEDIPF